MTCTYAQIRVLSNSPANRLSFAILRETQQLSSFRKHIMDSWLHCRWCSGADPQGLPWLWEIEVSGCGTITAESLRIDGIADGSVFVYDDGANSAQIMTLGASLVAVPSNHHSVDEVEFVVDGKVIGHSRGTISCHISSGARRPRIGGATRRYAHFRATRNDAIFPCDNRNRGIRLNRSCTFLRTHANHYNIRR